MSIERLPLMEQEVRRNHPRYDFSHVMGPEQSFQSRHQLQRDGSVIVDGARYRFINGAWCEVHD